jgi:hypothetical protein
LNIVKTTKIYESDVPISEVSGNFTDLSLWAFFKENGILKAKVLFRDSVIDSNGVYKGSLADVRWSDEAILSENANDRIPALIAASDDSGLLVWERAGALLTLPVAVLEDLLAGNFEFRYSVPVSSAAMLTALGSINHVVANLDNPANRNLQYLLYTRVNDETEWTTVGEYATIPNVDGENILHLRLVLYSKLTKKNSAPEVDQIELIYISNDENLPWHNEIDSVAVYAFTLLGVYTEQTVNKNTLSWK